MKPTLPLCARLRFSTKDVGKGFYRGNRTGSLGAHTSKGGYIIDYRKVRSYKVPDLQDFQLTPYVTREIGMKESPKRSFDAEENATDSVSEYFQAQDNDVARRTRAMDFIKEWKRSNPVEFDQYEELQIREGLDAEINRARDGEQVEVLERLKKAIQQSRDAESASDWSRS